MNATESFLSFFQENGGILTLGQIMKTTYACEYRRMCTELRQKGHKVIVVLNRKTPSLNTYYLDAAVPQKPDFKYEDNGQMVFA